MNCVAICGQIQYATAKQHQHKPLHMGNIMKRKNLYYI